MSDLSDRKARRTADALAYFCAHMGEIRDQLRSGQPADDTPVDELLAAVRGGQDVTGAVRLLHQRLQASGDARGLYGRVRGTGAQLAGIGPAGRPLTIHLCPHRRCTRHEWAASVSDAPPVCGVDGVPLLRKSV